MNLRRMRPLAVAGFVAALDQAAKWLVRRSCAAEGDGWVLVPGLLDFRLVRNTGAAWGLFAGFQPLLIVFSVVMLALIVWHRRSLLGEIAHRWLVLGLLSGGIVGNLIDRILLGHVVDFIDFHWGRSHFPAFNVADASICTGVGLFLLLQWLASRRERNGDLSARAAPAPYQRIDEHGRAGPPDPPPAPPRNGP